MVIQTEAGPRTGILCLLIPVTGPTRKGGGALCLGINRHSTSRATATSPAMYNIWTATVKSSLIYLPLHHSSPFVSHEKVNFFLSHCTRVCTIHTSTATCLMTKRPLSKIRKKSFSIAEPVTVQTKHYALSNDPPWQSLPLSSINFKHESGVPENSGKSPVFQTMVALPLPTCMSLMAP